MRFHVGFSFKAKVLLKYLAAIALGLLSFFGIEKITANALEYPSSCSDSSITDYVSCTLEGSYQITEDDISTACNIFLGDPSSLNWKTRQVAIQVDYDVNASDINTTYNSNLISLQQTSRAENGQGKSAFQFGFKRDIDDSPLYLSFTIYNMTSDTCQTISGSGTTCPPPLPKIWYCKNSDFTSCYSSQDNINMAYSNELIGDLRFITFKNTVIKTNAQIKQQYNQTDDFPYVLISFPNMPNSDTLSPPPINSGWNYTGVLLSSRALTSEESPTDNQYITNYCPNTGGQFINTGGSSVLDKTTSEIINEVNQDIINGAISQADNFLDTEINNHGVSSIVTAPITLLQGMLTASESCSPLSFSINLNGTPKSVSLPCGSILWNNVPSSVESIVNITIWGLLGFYVLIDLYKFIQDLHDPDKKNDYVMEL